MTSIGGAPLPAPYPAQWEADVVLADGGTVHMRPIRPSDAEGIRSLHGRLSAETIYLRFFSPLPTLSPTMLERFVNVDYLDRMALVAELGDEVIGVARFDRLPTGAAGVSGATTGGGVAEVAFTVDDAHQGRGVGTILLEHLAAVAKERGISEFVADTLPQNQRMLRVFHEAGFGDARTFADGVVRVGFAITPTEASVAAMHERERQAAARSVERLLAPRTIAVIGASRRPGSIGHQVLRNLLRGHFAGPVYPVHPEAHSIASVRAYHSIIEVPDEIDLAVIVVPSAAVPAVVVDCVRKHVGGLVVISSGFAERTGEGAAVERQLVMTARRNGMRLIGPNCMGVINTAPTVSMNATFAPVAPTRGRIGFISQSGGLGVVILDEMARRGLGVSTFVSAGNKADVSSNDLIQYWDGDDNTDVVLLYLESFGNPRTFARVARRLSRRKPIVAVKSGRSPAGTRAALQHTAAVAATDASVDALFLQSGVIRVDTLEELFDVAQLLASQPLPAGPRVAIVGNAGGPGVLAADACESAGLTIPELSPATRTELAAILGATAAVANPVDMTPAAGPDRLGRTLRCVLADDNVDAVIVLLTAPLATGLEADVGSILAGAAAGSAKTILAGVLGQHVVIRAEGGSVPSFAFPESAARALARVVRYAQWRRRPEGSIPELDDVDAGAARAIVDAVLAGPRPADTGPAPAGLWLDPDSAARLVGAYRIPVVADQAPVPDAVDTIVEVVEDQLFGPLITFSVGGIVAELMEDRGLRALPLTDVDAADLVRSIRAAPLLERADMAALESLVLRVAKLVYDIPEIAELSLRPVVASFQGAVPSAVRVRLAPFDPEPERAVRRLR